MGENYIFFDEIQSYVYNTLRFQFALLVTLFIETSNCLSFEQGWQLLMFVYITVKLVSVFARKGGIFCKENTM